MLIVSKHKKRDQSCSFWLTTNTRPISCLYGVSLAAKAVDEGCDRQEFLSCCDAMRPAAAGASPAVVVVFGALGLKWH